MKASMILTWGDLFGALTDMTRLAWEGICAPLGRQRREPPLPTSIAYHGSESLSSGKLRAGKSRTEWVALQSDAGRNPPLANRKNRYLLRFPVFFSVTKTSARWGRAKYRSVQIRRPESPAPACAQMEMNYPDQGAHRRVAGGPGNGNGSSLRVSRISPLLPRLTIFWHAILRSPLPLAHASFWINMAPFAILHQSRKPNVSLERPHAIKNLPNRGDVPCCKPNGAGTSRRPPGRNQGNRFRSSSGLPRSAASYSGPRG